MMVLLVLLATLDQQDHREKQVQAVLKVKQDRLEQLVLKAIQDQPVPQA
jgi:hypothetical protein